MTAQTWRDATYRYVQSVAARWCRPSLLWLHIFTVFVFLALGILSYRSIGRALAADASSRESYDALNVLDDACRILERARDGQRGYVITGDERFLGHYSGSRQRAIPVLDGLGRELPLHYPALRELRSMFLELYDEMDRILAVRSRQGMTAAVKAVSDSRGQLLMEAIRLESDRVRKIERGRIARLNRDATNNGLITLTLLPIIATSATASWLVILWLLWRGKLWQKRECTASEAQRRAERSLLTSRQQFDQLVEHVFDYAIILLDTDGTVLTWNRGAEVINRYRPDEIIGESFRRLYTREQLDAGVPESVLRSAEQRGYFRDECWRVRKDGTQFWASVTVVAIRDPDGRLINYLKITRDLSQRRLYELELKRAEARFRSIINLAPNAVIVADDRGTVVMWNNQATHTFGYTQDEILGRPILLLMPERYRKECEEALERATAADNIGLARHPVELVGLRKDGQEFPLELTLDILTLDSERSYLAILRDITERRQAELAQRSLTQQLKTLNAELVRSNSELDQFAAVASHDLKSPLRQIVSYVQLIERRYKELLDEEGRQFLQYVVDGAARMQELINDLLALSRAGAGQSVSQRVDMNRVLELALRNLNGWLADQHAEIHRQAELPEVWGEECGLVQVFTNLIGNGVKFSRGRPEIWIECRPHGQGWEFAVRDNGIGIEPEHQDQIWAMFKRLHGRDYPGTGIGLSIVKKVVEKHGGTVRVESQPGMGSTFYVILPAPPDDLNSG